MLFRSGGGAAPFSPVRSSTASVKLLPKNSMTKSTGPPPLLWLCLYHLFPRTVKLSCRFQRYSFPARVSCSPCDCRKETGSAWFARFIYWIWALIAAVVLTREIVSVGEKLWIKVWGDVSIVFFHLESLLMFKRHMTTTPLLSRR